MNVDFPTFAEYNSHGLPTVIGRKLCEIWGLNPQNVSSIEITVNPHEIYARADLEMVEGVLQEILHLTVTDRRFIERTVT